jgi:outer membrane lipoprotein-sorting protein
MLKKIALSLAMAALVVAPAQAQSLDDVLESYYEAIGGVDAWKAVESMRITGTITMQSMTIPFTMTLKGGDKVRRDFTVQGMIGSQAYDGEIAWQHMPFMGQTAAEQLPPEQAASMAEDAEIGGPLIDWERKGSQLELLGMSDVQGSEAFKIQITRRDGTVEFYYLDTESYLPIMVEGTEEQQGTQVGYSVTISDYKEIDGLMFAFSRVNESQLVPGGGQTVQMESVEVNADIDDSFFNMPEESGGN